MKIEHVAFNVADPTAVTNWYCEHLGFSVTSKSESAPAYFLADSTGQVMLEFYSNPPGEVPDYHSMNPLQLHLAFVSENPVDDGARLCAVGAKEIDDLRLDDGSHIKMLKDPWGLSIQLCKRGQPMI